MSGQQHNARNFVLDHNMNQVFIPDDALRSYQGPEPSKETNTTETMQRLGYPKGVQCQPHLSRRNSESSSEMADYKKCTIL